MRVRAGSRVAAALLLLAASPLFAQNQQETVSANIPHEDAVFWDAYNRCDVHKMSQFFSPTSSCITTKAAPR